MIQNNKQKLPVVLTVSATDPTGGAGMSADIRTCVALGVYPVSAVTAVTVQNFKGVTAVSPVGPEVLEQQLEAIYEAVSPAAAKIGMIPDAASAEAIAGVLDRHNQGNIVVDPVLKPTAGGTLGDEEVASAISRHLLPIATLVTPNIREYAHLRVPEGIAVLTTGGDLEGDIVTNLLLTPDGEEKKFSSARIYSDNLHGTGCVLSTAIAAGLATGLSLYEAVADAETFVHEAIIRSGHIDIMPYGPALTIE